MHRHLRCAGGDRLTAERFQVDSKTVSKWRDRHTRTLSPCGPVDVSGTWQCPTRWCRTAWNERELEQIRDGLIARVDGFFGHPTPIDHDGSGVPRSLRTVPVDR
jgi:hypothetical protein